VWRRLIDISREVWRAVVDTSAGAALLHEFTAASGPSLLWDDELHMDVCVGFWDAQVGEVPSRKEQ